MSSDDITRIAALDEPNRRRLYDHVVAKRHPVGRDEVAASLDMPRGTAAFHLDKLVDEGLLEVRHERRSGRSGPGAGRPAKLYLRSAGQIEVSLPERRYELAGRLLADAVAEAEETGGSVRDTLAQLARAAGAEIGAGATGAEVDEVLAGNGFEPLTEDDRIRLGNCPFHELAQRQTELVCGMNLELVCGVLDGLGDTTHSARLDPEPSYCCVVLERAQARGPQRSRTSATGSRRSSTI
jgi:predicted ArsR family transcriptional regulator